MLIEKIIQKNDFWQNLGVQKHRALIINVSLFNPFNLGVQKHRTLIINVSL